MIWGRREDDHPTGSFLFIKIASRLRLVLRFFKCASHDDLHQWATGDLLRVSGSLSQRLTSLAAKV
jgi:hypothetical protein